jgi:serine/threonine-protein phosphatase PP1 catalytic subunit
MDPRRQRLDAILNDFLLTKRMDVSFTFADAQWLCQSVTPVLLAEPTLLHLESPINICGDVHGQLSDLIRSLDGGGLPPFQKWLFLGDYVDRGPKSVEVICLLLVLKMRYPQHIYLLRGNHETVEMTEVFGFARECQVKLNGQAWQIFCKLFDYLPLAAVINDSVFCVHGGISPALKSLDQISEIYRPLRVPQSGIVTDLLWSDPDCRVRQFAPSDRGETFLWGLTPAKQFLKANGLRKIIRAHQVALNGYEFPFAPDQSVVTVFTASDYAVEMHNRAAFIMMSETLKCEFRVLPPMVTTRLPARGRAKSVEGRPCSAGGSPGGGTLRPKPGELLGSMSFGRPMGQAAHVQRSGSRGSATPFRSQYAPRPGTGR